jgi:hypothetical protein
MLKRGLPRWRRKLHRPASFLAVILMVLLGATACSQNPAATLQDDLSIEEFPVLKADHQPEDREPGPYNSNPPTSGPHFAASFQAGFYEQDSVDSLPQFPVGYLVHNLEHGYVIFWYNCQNLSAEECETLKDRLRGILDRSGNFKVIAFPWEEMDYNVVATTWGRMVRFDGLDVDAALDFINTYRNVAPEPDAP